MLDYGEKVNGTVIGPISYRFKVRQPNETTWKFWAESKEKAIGIMDRARQRAVDECPTIEIFNLTYGKGPWKLEELING